MRLYHRSQADIARYLLNYMGRDRRYTEKVHNCQAFAADFFSFVAGKKGIEVFLPLLRPLYTSRTHLFLYDPDMYNNPEPDEPTEELPEESSKAARDVSRAMTSSLLAPKRALPALDPAT